MNVGVDVEVFPVYRVPTRDPVYGVALGGVCNLTPEMSNPSADIAYFLTVINTGNAKDTIKLTTSGNTTAYLRNQKDLGSDGLLTDMTFFWIKSQVDFQVFSKSFSSLHLHLNLK